MSGLSRSMSGLSRSMSGLSRSMKRTRRAERSQRGVVLFIVLFFILLLTATIATFVRRVAVDAGISVNRDRAAAAEALARGGIRLAETLLLEDLRRDGGEPQPESHWDVWARAGLEPIFVDEETDTSLRLEIEDAAARLNLNALAGAGGVGLGSPSPAADAAGDAAATDTVGRQSTDADSGLGGGRSGIETRRLFLTGFLERVIDGLPGRPEEKQYDAQELAANLIDWIDEDDVRQSGGPEDEVYQRRDPPYRAVNRSLLSVDELRLVEGFDGALVDGLRPYVVVWPLAGDGGINLNTAPTWVLAQLTRGTDVSGMQPVAETDVRAILDAREEGMICGEAAGGTAGCTPVQQLFGGESIRPPMQDRSNFFVVRAIARVVDVERSIEAIVDRSDPAAVQRLAWRAR